MIKFGERLKAARTAKHMSQQSLADTLDVSCDYLLARTEAQKTAKVTDLPDESLAIRVSRIENHLGL